MGGASWAARLTRTSALRSASVIAVVIVLAVLVLVLSAWLFGTRNALREARHRGDELDERLESATRDVERAMGNVAAAEAKFDEERKRADQADADAADSAKEAEKAEAVARAAGQRVLALEQESVDASALWALEAVRFDRVWRDHAAVGPTAPSPLADTADPARSAVEILAEALREDSGTAIDVQWKADDVAAPGPAARLVRACEELFAVARSVDSGVVEVLQNGGDAYTVRLRTEPALAPPTHVVAALDAAGLDPRTLDDVVEVRVRLTAADPDT
jgi:F0F1-type ATP synthase membrane subunit b/b'